MKKTSKAKTKSVSKPRAKRSKHYSVHALVIAIALLITGESAIALNATAEDWKASLAILDVSSGISAMASDVSFVSQPAVETVATVNDFYAQAAVASTQLLDFSSHGSDSLMFVFGVNNFYKLASQQMANILDLSNYTSSWQPQVAGASISY